jgi:hypothetical protein
MPTSKSFVHVSRFGDRIIFCTAFRVLARFIRLFQRASNAGQENVCLGIYISVIPLSSCNYCKDTVFKQVTTVPFPVHSILLPHSTPNGAGYFACEPHATPKHYGIYFHYFALPKVCSQTLERAPTPDDVTDCLKV